MSSDKPGQHSNDEDEDEYRLSDAKSDEEEEEEVEIDEGDEDDDEDVIEEDVVEDEEDEDDEEVGKKRKRQEKETRVEVAAPVKRKRGRPPGSGKKKVAKQGRFQPVQVPLDENGVPYAVENDELMLPEDPKGEEKIDKLGVLKGGREFRIRTFTILGRGQRMYMLATEPARCIGFRDSYLLFQRHRNLLKVKLSDDEKFDLIERELIPHSYKGRTLGVVTARSIFREFGARVIVGGRRVVDDYYEEAAIKEGHTSAELADPYDHVPFGGNQQYDKNQYVAWYSGPSHQSSHTVYENNLKSVLQQQGEGLGIGPNGEGMAGAINGGLSGDGAPANALSMMKTQPALGEQRPDPPLDENLAAVARRSALEFNRMLAQQQRRVFARATQNQLLDHHTNVHFWPQWTQPVRSQAERLGPAKRGAVEVTTVLKLVAPQAPDVTSLPLSADPETPKSDPKESDKEESKPTEPEQPQPSNTTDTEPTAGTGSTEAPPTAAAVA